MRIGSLERIIASTQVARRSSSDIYRDILPIKSSIDHDNKRRNITGEFIKAIKLSDMTGLAKIISEDFADNCFLSTPDLNQTFSRKSRVMMYFGLVFETYPDGIWRIQTQNLVGNTMSIVYTFTGTRVFDQPIDTIFKYIYQHSMRNDANDDDSNDCDHIISSLNEYVHLPPSTDFSSTATNVGSTSNAISSDSNKSQRNSKEDDTIISVNSYSSVSVSSIPLNRLNVKSKSEQYITQQKSQSTSITGRKSSFSFSSNSATEIPYSTSPISSNLTTDPKVRELANKALKEGPVKQHRRMDIEFNELDQVCSIIIC